MDTSSLSQVINPWGAPTLDGLDISQAQPGQRLRGKNRQYVRFYKKKFLEVHTTKVKTNERTGEVKILETAPVEVEREMVFIKTPGDKNEIDDFADDWHKREFWPHYKAFRDGKTTPLGLPIEECSFISPSVATELNYLGVRVVEQLADASDDLCNRIADGWMLREYARAYCKTQNETSSNTRLSMVETELKEAKELIKALQTARPSEAPQPTGIILPESMESQEVKPRRGRPRIKDA